MSEFESIMEQIRLIVSDREKRLDDLTSRLMNLTPPVPAPEEGAPIPTALMDYDLVRAALSDSLAEVANSIGAAMCLQRKVISSHPLVISAEKERGTNV